MADSRRKYSRQMWTFHRCRDHVVGVDIYLITKHKMNRGKLQMVFNWMRSGEWLSTVMAQELFKMDASKLRYYIHQLKRRGYGIESETYPLTGVAYVEYYTQYRLTTWKPERLHS